jgi:hypothetical protein
MALDCKSSTSKWEIWGLRSIVVSLIDWLEVFKPANQNIPEDLYTESRH